MIDDLHARVRTALVDAGIDPMADAFGVLRVIDECLVDVDSPLDIVENRRQLLASFTGYGPLQPLFDDPSVEEIWINKPLTH